MKLDKIKKICSEFGNDTSCSLSFNRIKSVTSGVNNTESSETTDDNLDTPVETSIVEELPYVYTINTDLKNINIGFSKNINDADILDDDFEPGILTLAQLSHVIEPYSNDFNVIMNASNESEDGLNVTDLTDFSFNKEFLNHYLFSFLKNDSVFVVGEVNKDRYFDEPNTLLILTKVYYANTLTNYSYDYVSEKIDISSTPIDNYNNAILMCNISFNAVDDLVSSIDENNKPVFDNISFDDICIIRNRDNRDIFTELISLLFDTNLDETPINYKFKHYSVKSVTEYLKSVKYVIYEETQTITISEEHTEDVKVNKVTTLYIETPETMQSDISNYRKQAETDLTKLYNRLEFSDITTNILDGIVHKNFYTNEVDDKTYYTETKEAFKNHISEVITSIINTLNKIDTNEFLLMFNEHRDDVLTSVLDATYQVKNNETQTIAYKNIKTICEDNASLEYKHDTSAYYLIDTINYVVNYENGVRSSKMYFNMLNTDNLTDTLKLGNNIIYEYEDNTTGESPSGKKLNFSSKNIGNKLNKFTHYFYDDMDFGTIMLETKSDLSLVNDAQSLENNVLFSDNTDALYEIYIPNCITSLGDGLFSTCEKLSLLELPKYLTSIGENVFPRYGADKTITFSYAKNFIDSRLWLNKQFTGTYNYYAPNFNGYNTLLFYPTSNEVNILTKDTNDIDIVSIGKHSIALPDSGDLTITLDSTTEYMDDFVFKTISNSPNMGMLTINASNSPLWYANIPSYNPKFTHVNLQLNTLSPACLHYEPAANHTYVYTNKTFAKVQQNALLTITNNLYTDADVTSLVTTTDTSSVTAGIKLEEIHLTPGCKILNNEIRFIVSDNLTNDKFSLNFTLNDGDTTANYIAEYEFHSNIKINTSIGAINLKNFAVYVLNEQSVFKCHLSKAPEVTTLVDILGSETTANTLKTIYIQLKDNGDFESDDFYYYGESDSGGSLEVPPNPYYMVINDNNYEKLTAFIKTSESSIKAFELSNNALDYEDFANTLLFMNDRGESIKSNFINHGGLQYRTKTDSTPLNNIIVFPLFYNLTTTYTQSVNMFLKTVYYLYSIQLSDIRSLSQIGISKLLLNDNFNPMFIEFPESINRFYDCPIIIDKTYNKSELTIRFWSNFEDVITKKTLLDIDAIQNQIRVFSIQSTAQNNFTVSTVAGGSFTSPNYNINNSPSITSPTFGSSSQYSVPTNTITFTQNNEVMCICTTDDSVEKLIYINSENLKTLRIQVKEGEDYEHIYNFFKTNINKLVHINTPNNHVLNIVVETFVHTNAAENEIATYNFYDI